MSLAHQIAGSLRDAIREGRFHGQLPGERKLCQDLNASRPIVRQALHILREEKLLEIQSGTPARIIGEPERAGAFGDKQRVVLFFSRPQDYISQWSLMVIDELRRELYNQGYQFDLVIEPKMLTRKPEVMLRKLFERHRAQHWILAGTSAAIQEWFRQRPLNAITMGNAFPQMNIPFVNDDLRGVTRHAAGVFLRHGHRRIVFLMRDSGTAGEMEEEGGFRESIEGNGQAEGFIFKHSGSVEQIRARLAGIFAQPSPPTAFLMSHAEDTLTVMNWLAEKGIKVPGEVSIISFQWEHYLERIRPLPAWYYTDPKAHARKLCRLIFRPSANRTSPRLVVPVFFRNETVDMAHVRFPDA